jgi:NTE family protein
MADLSSFLNKFNLLKQIPIFSSLSWFNLQRIARKCEVVEYKKGDLIAKEGAPPDYFYCLISGRLQAYTQTPGGLKENVEFIHRGMYFGIISVLTGEVHSLNFEAINNSVVLRINKDDFHHILKSIPQLGVEFSQSLSQRMRKTVKGSKSVFESHIISVYSPVEGTGSSTYAVNLANSLRRETQKKVIFVNIASNATAPKSAEDYPYWHNPPAVLSEIVEDYELIFKGILSEPGEVDLLNVTFDAQDDSVKRQIAMFVSALVGDYHYVVVDLPNEMDDVVQETLTQSDLVHLLAFDKRKDLDMIKRVINSLEKALRENYRSEKIKVIVRGVHDKIYLSFEEINHYLDYDVYASLPKIYTQQQIVRKTKYLTFLACDDKSDYARLIRRIAREIGGVLIGIVLGGGAALGVAHIGVIRVLEREGIPIDIVVGSSMGALVAAIWATGKDAQGLEAVAREFERKSSLMRLFDPVIPISGLIGGRLIKRWLKKHLGTRTFYSTNIPLKIVAYDLVRREEIIINSGSLVDAVRKSVAIPGVIEPVREGEQLIIDGGVLNPLPTNVLSGLGIKKIIAVNVLQSPEHVSATYNMEKDRLAQLAEAPFWRNPFRYIGFRLGRFFSGIFTPNISDIIVRTLQATEFVISQSTGQQADVVIHPDLVGINWYELYKVNELIDAGEKATVAALPEIRKLVHE